MGTFRGTVEWETCRVCLRGLVVGGRVEVMCGVGGRVGVGMGVCGGGVCGFGSTCFCIQFEFNGGGRAEPRR